MADKKMTSELLVRKEAETSSLYGKKPDERTVPELISLGVVVIDKPSGPTSHQVSDFVQKVLHIEKAGHSGTLDPGVTGVLPVALDKATRIVQVLLGEGKEYVALMHLHKDVSEEKIREVFKKFIGKITQLPPRKSAVKRQERQRTIYFLEILEIDGQDVLFKVGCQAGTYIRKLIHDMGIPLGGAHMAELRRTKASIFVESQSVTLQDLADAYHYWKEENDDERIRKIIMPVEQALSHLKKVYVFDSSVDSLCHGSDLKFPGISKLDAGIKKDEIVAIMTLKDELVCLGTAVVESKEMLGNRGIAVKTQKVFMPPGIYPAMPRKTEGQPVVSVG
ncbi:MAG: RNA-guided pseudouridylation complex pseudouridine synthase subunit Cbf5 [Nanoarchaeota archaeon]|nr:RNA-guided pseudouridylation complex pseudouridine synthase subunit Cbf5 [Nanoarchaeota archaeon]